MSASSKKKLRKEQSAAVMTERQIAEQKEAKKVKIYTVSFVVVIALLLAVAIFVGVNQTIVSSGMREKTTVAVTVGDHKLSNAELSYFYIDAVNKFYSDYGSYASLFGLDMTKPLNEQYVDEEAGLTWADDFLTSAKTSAKSVYALADAAKAAGHTLPESAKTQVDNAIANMAMYATIYGYPNADAYLKAMYGNGASEDDYRAYMEMSLLADSYYTEYANSLTYDDAALREAEAENYNAYSAFSYNYYYLSADKFLTGGTTDDEGKTTYSDEEKAASVAAAEAAAKTLVAEEITSVKAFDDAISALEINAESETPVTSTLYEDNAYSSITEVLRQWVTDASRKEGDKTYIANSTTSTDAEGNETTTVSGYYVLYYIGTNDNTYPLANVRHILVNYEGGTTDETTGATVYNDKEKAIAKNAAEELLAQWNSGEKTEDSFATLANENSDDPGSNTTGGLYENVYPGQMVTNFNDWCFASDRKAGDTGIVDSDYGVHVMYYSGDSETNYRDHLISTELRNAEMEEWYVATVEALTVTDGDTSFINKGLVLSAQ